ncbi:MAG: glycosyltransferase [Elusimicrobiales bacterium]|jgi:rhamnosyltransferase|nr:glycosyltransferase [Elusimicrobiales bacterium]
MIRLAGAVILYNPPKNFTDNIKNYFNYLDKLYMIDNSEENTQYIEDIKKIGNNIVYVYNGKNMGVGYALNNALELSLNDGYDFLLTMDQDSRFQRGSIERMIEFINSNDTSNIAIISPEVILDNHVITDKNTPITSGSIINIKIANKIGGFKNDYFIDRLDFEYALRAKKNGYKIKVISDAFLEHTLGNYKIIKLINKKIVITNHLPIRRYYITRNTFCMIRNYFFSFPIYSFNQLRILITDSIKIILFEDRKTEKINMIIKGFYDFLIGKKGKYDK